MIKIIKIKDLLKLYRKGYFPMAKSSNSEIIDFYKPKKRFLIPIKNFHIPKKLFKNFKKNEYHFKINSAFDEVIIKCALPRKEGSETWINSIIQNTYIELFNQGYAKSIECFKNDKLVGGLYGVHLGGLFFGESMFSDIKNTSKYCLIVLVNILRENGFRLLDSQFYNKHLIQFGAYEISDAEYQLRLEKYIDYKCEFPKIFNI